MKVPLLALIGNLLLLTASVQSQSESNENEEPVCRPPSDFYIGYSSSYSQAYFYNNETKHCNIPIGAPCNRLLNDLENPSIPWACPDNSYCREVRGSQDYYNRATCSCTHKYNPTDDRRGCTLGKLDGETCGYSVSDSNESTGGSRESEGECAREAYLTCTNGSCQCANDDFWSNETSYCVKIECPSRGPSYLFTDEDQNCKLETHSPELRRIVARNLISCPENAQFVELRSRNVTTDDYSYEAANLNEEVVCVCKEGFVPSKNYKKCLSDKRFGDECDPHDSPYCRKDKTLYCNEKDGAYACGCDEGAVWNSKDSMCYSDRSCRAKFDKSFYDREQEKCVLEIYSKCNSSSSDTSYPNCPAKAICKEKSFTLYGGITKTSWSCTCEDGFIATSDERQCQPKKSRGEECNDELGNPCDPDQKLICQETKVCGCAQGQTWSEEDKRCELLYGESCNYYKENECGRNMECEGNNYGNRYRSTCQCKNGYTPTVDKLCLGGHQSACEANRGCLPGTICIDGFCKCSQPITQRYDKDSRTCVNLLGYPCNQEGEENSTSGACPANSACLEGTCKCNPGFSKVPSGECVSSNLKGLNDACSGIGECNFTTGLACIEGKCTCVDSSLESEAGAGCHAQVGSKCGWMQLGGDCSGQRSYEVNDQKCKLYHIGCGESAHCNYMGMDWSQCESITGSAPAVESHRPVAEPSDVAPPSGA